MSPSHPPHTISFLPPPGPIVFSARPPSSSRFPASASPTNPSTPQTFHDALTIRDAVFGLEQHCPADEEIDADDPVSWHWVLYADSVPAATIRLIPARTHAAAAAADDGEKAVAGPDYKNSRLWDHEEPFAMIGRVATQKEFRGRGYGRVLVEEALRWAGGNGGEVRGDKGVEWKGLLLAHAQVEVEGWYAGLGWRTDEGLGRWDEEGIPHVGMWRRVEVQG
ncbi:MAG: hypothetical protein ASARMPRED_008672 [Alectoria sarmentosa]|nr:MAG: hypothetical protein ASARMPRED_008672 [Alectoria sarmentosa]